METFYVTTPIYYANSQPHLGTLYTTVIADTLKRYKQQRGYETYFLTGTDEHGINIQRKAIENGLTPIEHTDQIVAEFKRIFAAFGLDEAHGGYDIFMRTSAPFHYTGVETFWRRAAQNSTPKGNSNFYKSHYESWFCPQCAAYKTEDEYEKQGEGVPPLCLEHRTPLDWVSEESYFFRLSDYADTLLELYASDPNFIKPEARRNEVISFVKSGLQDLSVSRPTASVSWGIPVPDDPSHTIYVWFDALTNYLTAIGFGNHERAEVGGYEKFWPALHLVGKDILRFHAVYWPAFLLAANVPVPKTIYSHGMLLDRQGRKMSKTLGNTVDLDVLQQHFSNDMVRYFILREVVFGGDGKVDYEAILDRANSDLAKGLGNLLSRTLSMLEKYCAGTIPDGNIGDVNYVNAKRAGVETDALGLASALELARDQYLALFDEFAFSRALEVVWSVIARVDKMLSDAKPWELVKQETQRETLNAVLYRAAETLRWLSVLLYPVMPEAANAIARQIGWETDLTRLDPANLKWGDLAPGTNIGRGEALFPRLDKTKIMTEIENAAQTGGEKQVTGNIAAKSVAEAQPPATVEKPVVEAANASNDSAPAAETNFIEIEDFTKVELRVGEILTAERVPKSDKLLRFTVDVGETEPRQILAGIAEHYEPETLLGRKIVVVANLKPRKLRGYESQGMVCAASSGDGDKPVLVTFSEDVPNGARLK